MTGVFEITIMVTTTDVVAITILIDLIKTAEDLAVVGNLLALEGAVLEITLAEVEAAVAGAEYVFNFRKDIARLGTPASTYMKRIEQSKNKGFPNIGVFFGANLGKVV